MKNVTDFRKTVETGVDPRPNSVTMHKTPLLQLPSTNPYNNCLG